MPKTKNQPKTPAEPDKLTGYYEELHKQICTIIILLRRIEACKRTAQKEKK